MNQFEATAWRLSGMCGCDLLSEQEEVDAIQQALESAYASGAAALMGLIQMAEAIRDHHPCVVGEHHWAWSPGRNDDVCARCGLTGAEYDAALSPSEEK